jgi:Ras GTPase-activating-like protein IQGAP2/3
MTNRYSVNAMYSLAAEQDVEIEDDLARAQKRLRDLKSRISTQSKKNFVLERDVRYLDSRIALLIQNRMAADEKREVAEALDEVDEDSAMWPDEKKMGQYANLFFLLQSEPRHVASLCRLVSLSEIDTLLQTVMFTLYGNQYEQREEHLLLTMFQVSQMATVGAPKLTSSLCCRHNSRQPMNSDHSYVPIHPYRE